MLETGAGSLSGSYKLEGRVIVATHTDEGHFACSLWVGGLWLDGSSVVIGNGPGRVARTTIVLMGVVTTSSGNARIECVDLADNGSQVAVSDARLQATLSGSISSTNV